MQKETGDKFSKRITWRDKIRRCKIECKGEIKKGEDKLSVVMQLETDFDK